MTRRRAASPGNPSRGPGDAPSASSDEALVERFRNGSAAALEELLVRNQDRVYAVALRMTGDRDDALDVTQEVFVSMMRALPRFRVEARVSTWLHRVTVNACLDLMRRRARRPAEPLRETHDRAADEPGPEASAVAAERASEVRTALARLDPEQRAVLVLHDLEDLDYREVAQILEIPLGTVKSRIHRGRVELARQLGHLREPAGPSGARGGEPLGTARPLREER